MTCYGFLGAYAQIWQGTPSMIDALHIMAEEPIFETGYLVPSFGVAEWSLTVTLPNLVQVLLVAILIVVFAAVWLEARHTACRTCKGGAAVAGAGVGILGLCSACLTWVVCCATPSWIVALSLLGMSLSVAQAVQPLDRLLVIIGMALLVLAIAAQARRIAVLRAGLAPHELAHESNPGKRRAISWRSS
jgi:hypothetical protein